MKATLIVLTLILLLHPPFAASARGEQGIATLPKGLEMEIALQDMLDSRTTKMGDHVRARLVLPLIAEGRVVVPENAMLSGKVTEVSGPQMGLLKAKINFIFTSINVRSRTIPIEASAHFDMAALAKKGGKAAGTMAAKEVAKRAIPVLGTVFLIHDVTSAAKFVTEEKEILIPAGTRMKVMLDKDVQVSIGHAAQ